MTMRGANIGSGLFEEGVKLMMEFVLVGRGDGLLEEALFVEGWEEKMEEAAQGLRAS
jgi:hypothetical protein